MLRYVSSKNGKGSYGFDAAKNNCVELVETGIIDPAKVVRIALENAVSLAGVLLLTEVTRTELSEENHEEKHTTGMSYMEYHFKEIWIFLTDFRSGVW